MRTDDGAIIPHFLNIGATGGYTQYGGQMDNLALRVGEVIARIAPENPRSISAQVWEYSVVVQESNGYGPIIPVNYEHCFVANLFGNAADKFTYTLRPATQPGDTKGSLGGVYTNGSKVLLLCINGQTNNAFILGALWDPNSAPQDGTLEHNALFQFNGLSATVNKDGELEVTFNGAQTVNDDNSVSPSSSQNQANVGAFFNMLKDGTFNISAPQNVTIKSAGVLTGDATDHTVLGDTYITAEMNMLSTVASDIAQAASMIQMAGRILSGLSTIPSLSPVSAAGSPLAWAAQALNATQDRINQFVNKRADYLSKKNLSD